MNILKNYSLKPHNTFQLDVSADYFASCNDDAELLEILNFIRDKKLKHLIIGGGSNILLTKDFDGIVIEYKNSFVKITERKDDYVLLEIGAGKVWDELVQFCVENNFGGIENLSLIPGNVGAAPIQNIGAYGQEVSNTLLFVNGFFLHNSEKFSLSKEECRLGYRDSIFKNELKNRVIITSVVFILSTKPKLNLSYGNLAEELNKTKKNEFTIQDVRDTVIKIRKNKLPDPKIIGNAGSFFKNPTLDESHFHSLKREFPEIKFFKSEENKYKIPAAWLIEQCGLKGYREGRVGIHDRQPLVIVNYGGAIASEILSLKNKVQKEVFEKFQIHLEEEVNII